MGIKTCEIEAPGCDVTENLRSYAGMIVCGACYEKEMAAQAEMKRPENQQARVDAMNQALATAKTIDATIQVRTDLFNAATVAIVDLKKTIDDDPTITNKPYALAEALTGRFNHYKQVVFDLNQQVIEAGNHQKAIQVYLNQLANQLRSEEREKLKIQDINYKPNAVKPVKPKAVKAATNSKATKEEIRKYCQELGVAEFTFRSFMVSTGRTAEQTANALRKSINEAKSEA